MLVKNISLRALAFSLVVGASAYLIASFGLPGLVVAAALLLGGALAVARFEEAVGID